MELRWAVRVRDSQALWRELPREGAVAVGAWIGTLAAAIVLPGASSRKSQGRKPNCTDLRRPAAIPCRPRRSLSTIVFETPVLAAIVRRGRHSCPRRRRD